MCERLVMKHTSGETKCLLQCDRDFMRFVGITQFSSVLSFKYIWFGLSSCLNPWQAGPVQGVLPLEAKSLIASPPSNHHSFQIRAPAVMPQLHPYPGCGEDAAAAM